MRETAAILVNIWLVGILLSRTLNGILHLLPLVAIVLIVFSFRKRSEKVVTDSGAEANRSA